MESLLAVATLCTRAFASLFVDVYQNKFGHTFEAGVIKGRLDSSCFLLSFFTRFFSYFIIARMGQEGQAYYPPPPPEGAPQQPYYGPPQGGNKGLFGRISATGIVT